MAEAMQSTPDLLVQASRLHTYYGNSHVLHGVDLTIARGESVCLLGRNGMGKTTTIRSILGLTPPREGRVLINGRDVSRAATHQIIRQGIGYVPEGRGMFPNLTVRESLVMAARPGRDGRNEWDLARVLQTFPRLAERIDHLAGNLSGGERSVVPSCSTPTC